MCTSPTIFVPVLFSIAEILVEKARQVLWCSVLQQRLRKTLTENENAKWIMSNDIMSLAVVVASYFYYCTYNFSKPMTRTSIVCHPCVIIVAQMLSFFLGRSPTIDYTGVTREVQTESGENLIWLFVHDEGHENDQNIITIIGFRHKVWIHSYDYAHWTLPLPSRAVPVKRTIKVDTLQSHCYLSRSRWPFPRNNYVIVAQTFISLNVWCRLLFSLNWLFKPLSVITIDDKAPFNFPVAYNVLSYPIITRLYLLYNILVTPSPTQDVINLSCKKTIISFLLLHFYRK